ncbi:MAG: hypothetical protein WDN04_13735 [Rhodospirillales bacterium]
MGMRLTRLLTFEEFAAMSDKAVADGFWRNDPRVFTPGMGWVMPWYWDPTGERERIGKPRHDYAGASRRARFLADKRPPICIVGPNGETWEIDRKSKNGDGWKVTGEWPNLTCTPSIVVEGYHGILTNGEFGLDLDGRGEFGIARPITPRVVEKEA